MGVLKRPLDVKLFVGMLCARKDGFDAASTILSRRFGPQDAQSGIYDFNCTDYYKGQMGSGLLRKFISFKKLINPADLYTIKLFTNKVEKKFTSKSGLRRINLDPGYLAESKLVLATTKDFQHRIYLKGGIFAEVTLKYQDKEFRPYEWTYPDYRTKNYIGFFMLIRGIYKTQIDKWKRQRNTGL